jgi:hypothetical protein
VARTEIIDEHGMPRQRRVAGSARGLAAARDKARKSIAPAIVVTLILVAAITMIVVGYIAYG